MNRKVYLFINIILILNFIFYCSCKRQVRKGVITAYKGQKCFIYEIRRGDSLWKISQKFSVSVNDIKKVNSNLDPKALKIGNSILVPVSKTRSSSNYRKKKYTKKVSKKTKKRVYRNNKKIIKTKNKPVFHNSKSYSKFSWPVKGKIITKFKQKINVRNSDGIEISAAYKTPIYSAGSGKIVYSGTMDGYGNIIIIDHLDGFFTLYAYNSLNILKKDSLVKKHTLIAYSGKNPNNSKTSLHFQIRFHGKPVDPLKYLK